jgi:tetratricopeptide (TPR) repeat protein
LRAAVFAVVSVAAVIAVGVAFVWLPALMDDERRATTAPGAPAPVPAVAAPARPTLSPEERAALKTQAEDLLAGLLELEDTLTRLNVATWATADWERYRQLSEGGDTAFLDEDYAAAVEGYSGAAEAGNALVARAAADVAGSFAAAEGALAAGNAEVALEQYDIVLTIDPTHAGALAGRARAERLPEVLALVQRAESERARGELDAALDSYRAALAIDAEWRRASLGLDEVTGLLRDAEFERLLSAGYGALTSNDFAAARTHFETALQLRPASSEARDGLVQADEGAKLDQIALAEARALAFERRELWDQAIALYRSVLESNPTLVFAQTGLERAEERAGLDAKLEHLIGNPTLLFGDAVLADARALLEQAGSEQQKGPRLEKQIAELGRLVELASTPIPVQLVSDQLTSVTLYRVGTLGAFAAREVELRPGTYTVIGSRDGYRDVRQTFTVRPGRNLPPINVVCVEPI